MFVGRTTSYKTFVASAFQFQIIDAAAGLKPATCRRLPFCRQLTLAAERGRDRNTFAVPYSIGVLGFGAEVRLLSTSKGWVHIASKVFGSIGCTTKD